MDQLVGESLGQYEIVRHLADGGMAQVYLAHQATMSRHVAVKLLPRDYTDDSAFIDRFYAEVEIIAKLQHPHILPVYDFGTYQDMPYIVMAYINSGTLQDCLSDAQLTTPDILKTTQQIVDALEFAHSKNIIHRDLKPANVLMDELGNAYLADFGLAKIVESGNQISHTDVVGTPHYIPPEMIQSQPGTTQSDIYSLGVMFYEMLTGEPPYQEESMIRVLLSHINEPIPKILEQRPDLPDGIQSVIDFALAKEPEDRYKTVRELMDDIQRVFQPDVLNLAESAHPALLMTDIDGHVIFLDNQCLSILKRQQHEARLVIGKPMSDVLGIDPKLAGLILETVSDNGEVVDLELVIMNSRGNPQEVRCNAVATLDDKGKFIGADIKLTQLPKDPDKPISSEFTLTVVDVNTQEQTYVQDYFIAQIECLWKLSKNWGGKKVAQKFDALMNELADRNDWAVQMDQGKLTINLSEPDIDVFKALVARGMTYAAHMIGSRQVIKELERLDKKTDNNVLIFVRTLGYDRLYDEILD